MDHNAPPPRDTTTSIEDQRLRIATVAKPPDSKTIVENLGMTRAELDSFIQSYREQLKAYYYGQMPPDGQLSVRTVHESVVDDVLRQNPGKHTKEELMKMRQEELATFLNRFDWRKYAVVPAVRDQHPNQSCWAYAATEAFESSLMIQRSNFSTRKNGAFWIASITLNVHSTSDCVPPNSSNLPGRHEEAFNYYLKTGIPLHEIRLGGVSLDDTEVGKKLALVGDRDVRLNEGHCHVGEKDRLKIVGWDYVHSELQPDPMGQAPQARPWEIPEIDEMKKALLEHGPLVIAINSDKAFQDYGSEKFKQRDFGALVGKDPITGTRFEQDQETGDLFIRFPAKLLPRDRQFGGIDFDAIEVTRGNKVRLHFLANAASVFKHGSHNRKADADQPVEVTSSGKYVFLKVPKSNDWKVKDAADGTGTKLYLPKNTETRLMTDSATGNFVVEMPDQLPTTPVYKADPELDFNHFVLLVGWDDKKCAWIIQNTYGENWGYGCDFEGGWTLDGGYAYVTYNTIGQFAAWVEALLVEQGLKENAKPIYPKAS